MKNVVNSFTMAETHVTYDFLSLDPLGKWLVQIENDIQG